MTAARTHGRPFRREATGAVPFESFAASAEEVNDSAWSGESVALGWREADVECGFELIAELDQVEGVATQITNKGGVEADLRRRFAVKSAAQMSGECQRTGKRATRPRPEEWL